MNLRRFNADGVDQFTSFLAELRNDPKRPLPPELCEDVRFTELIEPVTEIGSPVFESKYTAAKYLYEALQPVPRSRLSRDVQLWAWLAFRFFDQLCPADGHGRRSPRENPKYIPRAGDHRYGPDKHLLFFPWKMYSLHGEAARFFLADVPGKDTRAQREWTGYYHNLSTPLVELAARLYGDQNSGTLKRGATSSSRKGNLRRYVQVAKQLEVTFDLHGMSVDELMAILPRGEFGRWMAA